MSIQSVMSTQLYCCHGRHSTYCCGATAPVATAAAASAATAVAAPAATVVAAPAATAVAAPAATAVAAPTATAVAAPTATANGLVLVPGPAFGFAIGFQERLRTRHIFCLGFRDCVYFRGCAFCFICTSPSTRVL